MTPVDPVAADFERLFALIALVADAKAAAKRLQELRDLTLATAEATAVLDSARAAHDQQVARDRADIEQQRKELREREVRVHAAELANRRERQSLIAATAERNEERLERFPGGVSRERIGV